MIRLGVLASGSGTNLQAILDACAEKRIEATVAAVVVNVPGAGAIARAEKAGVPVELIPSKGVDRDRHDARIVERLAAHGVELVCLAGYMRLVGPVLLDAFGPRDNTGCPRVVNIHPALLPSFPGLHAQRQALDYGAVMSGCTVHFVDRGTDSGPIIAQAVVPVLPGDGEEALAARILVEEHRLYPACLGFLARGEVALRGRRVVIHAAPPVGWPSLVAPFVAPLAH